MISYETSWKRNLETGWNRMANRTGKGCWQPGQSGNPSGRPKIVAEIRALARVHGEAAIGALVEIVGNEKAPPAARVSAANALLDRGYGRPESKIDATVETPTQQFDLTKLSAERFALLSEILEETRVDGESDAG
jgi:hypothetical protein